jgi:hypothetical protein
MAADPGHLVAPSGYLTACPQPTNNACAIVLTTNSNGPLW